MGKRHSSLNIQVGGGHYKDMVIEPAEFIHKNRIPFLEGNAIKYSCRHRAKNGAEDVKKAIHYLMMVLDMDYGVKVKVKFHALPTHKKKGKRRVRRR